MAPIIRKFKVRLGALYPENIHERALELISKLETNEFKISSFGLSRGGITHGDIKISWPNPQNTGQFFANITITFFNIDQEESPLTEFDENGNPDIPSRGSNFKTKKLLSYPTIEQLIAKAETP